MQNLMQRVKTSSYEKIGLNEVVNACLGKDDDIQLKGNIDYKDYIPFICSIF